MEGNLTRSVFANTKILVFFGLLVSITLIVVTIVAIPNPDESSQSQTDPVRILDSNTTVRVDNGFNYTQYRYPINRSFTLINNGGEDIKFNISSNKSDPSRFTINNFSEFSLQTNKPIKITLGSKDYNNSREAYFSKQEQMK